MFSRSGGHKTKETYPTRPGSPTPCKQALSDAITPYRAKNSCETTLIRLTETWRAELDSKKIVGILSSDMSKALNFVSLSPQLLINNLQAYKFSDKAIQLIRSYFQGREKRVRIGSVTSDWLLVVVKRGCPQGSTFGAGGTCTVAICNNHRTL